MTLLEVVEAWRRVGATRSRLEKIAALAELLRRARPDEVPTIASWLVGELRQGRMGLGPSLLQSAGAAAPAADSPSLLVEEADAAFTAIRDITGAGSAGERRRVLAGLLGRATDDEREFLARLVLGELRQGALEGVMVDVIARAAQVDAGLVRRACMNAGDLGEVASAALRGGSAALAAFTPRVLTPIQPMLAQTASGAGDALARLGGEAALDAKLDGARVQVHRLGDEVRVFSRSLRDVTASVPEVVEAVRALDTPAAILDGEAIALHAGGAPRPFQVTMRRFGRGADDAALRRELPLSVFFFDVLHAGGDDLMQRPARERFERLEALVPRRHLVPRIVTADPAAAAAFLEATLRTGHEGVVAKALDSTYEAGNRGSAWLKVKPAHTLDLVVLAAEWGSGRRVGFLSNLHLAARDPASGGFAMLGKTFKGMTDAMLAWQTERLLALELGREGHVVHVRPELVVEVAFDGLQASPRYPSGLALRFARVKRWREDKRAADADTIDTVRELHARQRERGP
jgi:DNA ligase-1